LTRQKTKIQHIDFPNHCFKKSLQRITPILFMINFVDSMDCSNLLEFPKLGYLLLKSKTTKPKYKQNTNIDSWEKLLAAFETSRTSHHSPYSTIIPS
jgi:hypothetical protein